MDAYEQAARERRAPGLQALLDNIAQSAGIEPDFVASGDHPYTCRCDKCLAWWATMGPDGDPDDPDVSPSFGPFKRSEIEAFCTEVDRPMWWKEA